MSNYIEKYNDWVNNPYFDEEDREALLLIKDNKEEIEDAFYKDLEFGTGGLRGIIGLGTNRINKYTIQKATQGLANYIKKCNRKDPKVVIAYDSRYNSDFFANCTALCLNANGIKTYIFPTLAPTPELSFALRTLNAIAGVVITASHNPKEYNGYKVYWEDGAQITPPTDKYIIDEVNKIENYEEVKTISIYEARAKGLYNFIGYEVDDAYIEALKNLSLDGESIKSVADDLKIVYTPFNGTGNIPVRRVLNELGFKNVFVVKEQEEPDATFKTLEYPNPEDKKAFTLALKLAKDVCADIILATDPDADRLGIYAKDENGEYIPFTGNMSAMLMAEYIFSKRKEKGILHFKGSEIEKTSKKRGVLVTTIVSTNMAKAVAKEYGLDFMEVLTGFKYIGEQIKLFEENKNYFYEFGFEESYGALIGTHSRDKDAPAAVMVLCEAAAHYKSRGINLVTQMENIYKKYGYYIEDQVSITKSGVTGASEILAIMEDFRKNPPKTLGNLKVIAIRDYKEKTVKNLLDETVTDTNLPTSNVIYFDLEDDAWCCVRPSGTEPKIKFYIGTKGSTKEEANKKLLAIKEELTK